MKPGKSTVLTAVSWTAVAVCMGIIFFLSSQDGSGSQALSDNFTFFLGLPLYFVRAVRKAAHFLEFTVLAVLFFNALYRSFGRFRPFLSFLLTAAYAASDEFHQLSVDGRACRIFDFFVDCAGAATGIAVLYLLIFLFGKLKSWRG